MEALNWRKSEKMSMLVSIGIENVLTPWLFW